MKARPLIIIVLTLLVASSCRSQPPPEPAATVPAPEPRTVAPGEALPARTFERADERAEMVAEQIAARGVADERVLAAMREVPRHEFMPEAVRRVAYADSPQPIGNDQTISQPYIVAFMSEALAVEPGQRVLEIGTGSGYQAAVLAAMGAEVYTIEIVCELADRAREALDRLGYGERVTSKCGDGYAGWPEHAPFDRVIVTAAPPKLPQTLVDQLAPGGRLVVPEGEFVQELVLLEKDAKGKTRRTSLLPVRFVPMVPGSAPANGDGEGEE